MGRVSAGPGLWGLILIGLGLVWLLNNLEIISVDIGELLATYWPAIFILWGLEILLAGRETTGRPVGFLSGLVLVGLGAALIARATGLFAFDISLLWRILWPLLIILIGVHILRGRGGAGRTAVMSGIKIHQPGWELTGGSYTAIMGGIEMDLRVASIPPGTTSLELTAIMGGIDVRVPAGLAVECEGTAILGGVEFFDEESGGIVTTLRARQPGEPGASRLIMRCTAIMGGIEIKR